MAHHCSRFDDTGYEADDEGRSSRVISPSLFRTTTFFNPFDDTIPQLCPCDQPSSSISNVNNSVDAQDAAAPPPAHAHILLEFMPPPNSNGQNNSNFDDYGSIALKGRRNSSSREAISPQININSVQRPKEEVGDNSNNTPTSFLEQENEGGGHNLIHEDGHNIAVTNTSDRVSDNKHRNSKRIRAPPHCCSNGDAEVPKRTRVFIGIHHYKRTNRWEAYMWYRRQQEQLWFGQHFIAEAAARTSDKAQLVLRNSPQRKLNYPEEDYDINCIQKWRELDSKDFEAVLREQAKDDSEGCTLGLTDKAANQLRQQINEFKRSVEASKQEN